VGVGACANKLCYKFGIPYFSNNLLYETRFGNIYIKLDKYTFDTFHKRL